jgi:AcrR family transcriptional regulator
LAKVFHLWAVAADGENRPFYVRHSALAVRWLCKCIQNIALVSVGSTVQTQQVRILQTALIVFSQTGFAQARMSDIARECGVAKGSIYRHFKSKEDLASGVCDMILDDIDRAFARIDSCKHIDDLQLALVSAMQAQISKGPHLMVLLDFVRLAKNQPAVTDNIVLRLGRVGNRIARSLALMRDTGIESGTCVAEQGWAVMMMLQGVVGGTHTMHLGDETRRRIVEQAVALCMHGLFPSSDP